MAPPAAELVLLSYTSLRSGLFGIAFTLYCMCVQLWYKDFRNQPLEQRRKHHYFSFTYTTLIVVLDLISLAVNMKGGLAAAGPMISQEPSLGAIHFAFATRALVETLIASMQIWRVWVIWALSPHAIFAASIPLVIFLASESLWIASSAPVDFNWVSNDSKTTGSAKELANAADALTTAFHIIFTILVVGRLMYLRRRLGRLAGYEYAECYTNVAAMIVESYFVVAGLYLAGTIIRVVSNNTSKATIVTGAILDQIEVIAYLLVMYRVLQGRAWTQETGQKISSLRWNHPELEEGNDDSGGDTLARSTSHVSDSQMFGSSTTHDTPVVHVPLPKSS